MNFSFVNTAVVEYVASLTLSDAVSKSSLVIGAVFKEELSAAMELLISPFTMIESFGLNNLFVRVTKDSLREKGGLLGFVCSQLEHLLSNDSW